MHENDEDQDIPEDIPDDDASPDPVIDEPEAEEAEPEKQPVAPLPATAAQLPTAAAAATAPNKEAVTLDESMALLEKLQKQVSKDPNNAQVTASNKDEGYVR